MPNIWIIEQYCWALLPNLRAQHRDTFIDNTIPPPPLPTTCVIKLDQTQYAFYKKRRFEIHSPTGQAITVLSKQLPVVTDQDAIYQLYCQTHLLEVLFHEVNERVRAINSIARVIDRIDGHLKKQLSM